MSDTVEKRPTLPAPFTRGSKLLASDFESMRQAIAFSLKSMLFAGNGILLSRRGDSYIISASRESHITPTAYQVSVSPAALIPTSGEISTAIASAYSVGTPKRGDKIIVSVSSSPKFVYTVTGSATTSGIWIVSFTVSSITYYAIGTQLGLY